MPHRARTRPSASWAGGRPTCATACAARWRRTDCLRATRRPRGRAGGSAAPRPRPGDGLEVDALVRAALPQPLAAVREGVDESGMGGQRQQGRGTRQGGAAEQGTDLPAEAAARDEDETLGALGELVEELHRHAAAERVADE